uniref:PB1 domain-containing protein n=1 Tax=Nothobranchius pienaari TaxID=704102 RepID=A0A1A8LSW4_9TELE
MAAARLKVILGENNVEKLILPNGIPQSLLELVNVVKNTFGITTEIRLQYMDQDFGNEFFNLNATSELQDLGTIKVVQQEVVPLVITLTDDVSSACATFDAVDCSLQASNNTNILPSPPKLSFRSVQWPAVFPIPQFSYDTELVLERGNAEYKSSSKLVYLSTRTKSDILNKVSEEIFKYKAYPCDEHFVAVAEALIKKHPCLKEPGSSNGWVDGLFDQREINAEFQRLVALPLEQKFFSQLDKYSTKLMTAIRSRGGSTREKISGLTQIFDQIEDVNKKRECVLKALVPFLGEDGNVFIKEYADSHQAEMQKDCVCHPVRGR